MADDGVSAGGHSSGESHGHWRIDSEALLETREHVFEACDALEVDLILGSEC
jgi:hypothetical protein